MLYTYVICNGKSYKIDGGSCMKIVSHSTIDKTGFKIEPHPQ